MKAGEKTFSRAVEDLAAHFNHGGHFRPVHVRAISKARLGK